MRLIALTLSFGVIFVGTTGALLARHLRAEAPPPVGRVDFQANPLERPCPTDALVIMAVGQSNAASHGEGRRSTNPKVFNFYRGKCYAARDPLLGSTGDGGSVWTRLGDMLAHEGRTVVLVPLAVGGSRMAEWAPGGIYHDRVSLAERELTDRGLAVDLTLVVQGETEGVEHANAERYRRDTVALLKSLPGKVFMATTTNCEDGPVVALRLAQDQARKESDAFPGPDLDRHQRNVGGCHFDARELMELATEWREDIGRL